MRIILILIGLAAGVAVLGTAGCGAGSGAGERPTVIAAFYPLAFAAERIGAQRFDVVNLTPPGAEPHDIELTARDVDRVRSAAVVLYLGGGFQPALEDALQDASGRRVDVLQGVSLLRSDGEVDPHVWLDPVRFAAIVRRIGRVLRAPARARSLVRALRRLDRDFQRTLSRCARRELVTSHAAFGYLADRYGLRQVAITGRSPEAEPTPRAVEHVVDEVRRTQATTIFVEPLVSARLAETVARETGAATAVLDPLEGLDEGALADGADYLSVMRHNLAALRAGLGCRRPSS